MSPQAKTVALFPGQGASARGCQELVRAHCPELYDAAREQLGADPFDPADTTTRLSQPAVFLAGVAQWRACEHAGLKPHAYAGHSLGEITALTAAGVFSANAALELVILRGELMDDAASASPGGMVAILNASAEQALRLANDHGLHVANYNAPGQVVLSGSLQALDDATRDARERGFKALKLSVSGPFHSPAVASAREPLRQALARIEQHPASAPVYSSMTATPFTDPVSQLADAVTQPVRWQDTMTALDASGATAYLDVGPDRVLERLTTRNLEGATTIDRDRPNGHA